MSRALVFMMLLLSAPAFAGQALTEAQQKRSKGFNDFYRQYRTTKPKKAEDVSSLTQKTVKPANEALTRALAQEGAEAMKASGLKVMSPEQADAAHAKVGEKAKSGDSKPTRGSSEKEKPATSVNFDSSQPVARPAAEPTGTPEKKPETVVDGTKVPNKIDFSKKK